MSPTVPASPVHASIIPARRGREWLELVAAHPGTGRSSRGRANVLAVARALYARATADLVTRPTWEWLAARAGVGRRTVARHLARLQRLGLLVRLQGGRSATATRGALAAVYRLTQPAPPPAAERPPNSTPSAPAASATDTPKGINSPKTRNPRTHARGRRHWDKATPPKSRGDMLAAARELQAGSFPLRRLSARHLRSVLRPFFAAGWTVPDVRYAIDTRPDGTPWPHSGADGVRHMAAWLRHRLGAWQGPDGPVPSRSQRAAATAAAQRERAAQRRAEEARAREAAAPMPQELQDLMAAWRASGRRRKLTRPRAFALTAG